MSKHISIWFIVTTLILYLTAGYASETPVAQTTPEEILRIEYRIGEIGEIPYGRFIQTMWALDVAESTLTVRGVNETYGIELYSLRYAIPQQLLETLVQTIAQSDFCSLPENVYIASFHGAADCLTVSYAESKHAVSGIGLGMQEPFSSIINALNQVHDTARKSVPLSRSVPRDEPLRISLISQFFSYAWGMEMRVAFLDQYGDIRVADLKEPLIENEINNLDDVFIYLSDSARSEVVMRTSPDLLRSLELIINVLPDGESLEGKMRAHDCGLLFRYAVRYNADGIANTLHLSTEGEVLARRVEPEARALCAWLDLYQPGAVLFSERLRYRHDMFWNFWDVLLLYGEWPELD